MSKQTEALKLALEWVEDATVVLSHPDDQAVDRFAAVMKDKLAKAREKGRGGWETCPPSDLSRMLREHVEKGDPRDVANFCMMLWSLGAGIAAQPRQELVGKKTRIGLVTSAGWDSLPVGTEFYTSPPAHRKPLTDEDFSKLCLRVAPRLHRTADAVALLQAIEAAHGIKENT